MRKPVFSTEALKEFLDERVSRYNQASFITNDPISIPHSFSRKQDIEIAGLFAAILAWGQRTSILRSCTNLMQRMDNEPYDFVLHHTRRDLKKLEGFVHRTFNDTDLLYFIHFLHYHYRQHDSLETLFQIPDHDATTEKGLINFHRKFFCLPDHPTRTRKHIASPERKSACKRINMFLRWMVRHDHQGVDFGIWKSISPRQLICPLDLHVERVARELRLIRVKGSNWQAALDLTAQLRLLDPEDPVKYDFALFGLGIIEDYTSAAARRSRSLIARPSP